jgi:hypothetical protein
VVYSTYKLAGVEEELADRQSGREEAPAALVVVSIESKTHDTIFH